MKKSTLLTIALGALPLTLVLAGCGGNSDEPTPFPNSNNAAANNAVSNNAAANNAAANNAVANNAATNNAAANNAVANNAAAPGR